MDELTWLYFECTHFMLNVAELLGMTYRDANAGLFFLIWPAVTVGLALWVAWNACLLRRLRPRS